MTELAQVLRKTCCDCMQPKPLDAFYRLRKGSDDRQARCKACDNACRRARSHAEALGRGRVRGEFTAVRDLDTSYFKKPERKPDPLMRWRPGDPWRPTFWRSVADKAYNAWTGRAKLLVGPRPPKRKPHQSPFVGNNPHILTRNQYRLLGLIRGMLTAHGRPPTYREMKQHMEWRGDADVSQCLNALQRKGKIRRPARGVIELVKEDL
jgi:hypothetical protein